MGTSGTKLQADRPDLSAYTADEVWAMKRAAAQEPVPGRQTCPGCLRPMGAFAKQLRRGWCPICWVSRDRILAELLRVPDPAWRKPAELERRERDLARVEENAARLSEGAEVARRRAAELQADLTYARASAHVCVQCGNQPAVRPSTLCQLCSDVAEAPPPRPRLPLSACPYCGGGKHPEHEHRPGGGHCLVDGCTCVGGR